jgi:conjugal transfer pilus assembly protein TraI
VQALLEADQLPGIPKAPETVLELLLAAGVIERQDSEHVTWTILPPEAKTPLEAVKLASAAILFAGVDAPPPPLEARLVCRPGDPLPARPKPPTTPSAPPGTQLSLIAPAAPLRRAERAGRRTTATRTGYANAPIACAHSAKP